MICKRGKFLNGKVKRVDFLLKLICEENGYLFIDNNIEIRDYQISIILYKSETSGKKVYIY